MFVPQELLPLYLPCMQVVFQTKHSLVNCGLLSLIEPGDSVMADKGFDIAFDVALQSALTGVGSFLDFPGIPHFLGREVELGGPCAPLFLFISSTANIRAAVWLQAEVPATQVQLAYSISPLVLLRPMAVLYAPHFCDGSTVARMME